jgi:hypothetical protein
VRQLNAIYDLNQFLSNMLNFLSHIDEYFEF